MRQGPADQSSGPVSFGSSGYLSEDTIVSRISGTGGAISVLRLSGPSTLRVLEFLVPETRDFVPRRMNRVSVRSRSGALLDDAMLVIFQGPRSFTGEDVAELYLHGGSYIASAVLQEILRLGVRQALPGEFSFRAVRNGKMTVDQAHAVHDLISATNASAHHLALERLSGVQSRIFFEMAETLRGTLALAEAGIDFSDQDLDELALERLKIRIEPTITRLASIASSIDRGRRIQEGVSLVLAGLPNAGKSTLFNGLLGQDRSLTSEEAGTTRDVIREPVRLRASRLDNEATFVAHDTAGLRKTTGEVERQGIELTHRAAASADIVLFIIEAASNSDLVMTEWNALGRPNEKTVLVLNKADRLSGGRTGPVCREEISSWQKRLGVRDALAISASQHDGINELIDALVARAGEWLGRQPSETVLTRQEQVNAVERALLDLRRALKADAHDIFAADLRQALDQLSFFIGATPVDDVLGRIFSQFCIGK